MDNPLDPTRTGRRVRHEIRFRLLTVLRVSRPTPGLCRVVLGGAALEGFVSAAHDDHVKLFFPAPGETTPILPVMTPDGPRPPDGTTPIARDYTPRRHSEAELEIDFVLHGDGPAASWAAQAAPGQTIGAGGPRGSFIVPDDFDWYLFIGDETALPAIARRLAELPATAHALVLAEVTDATEEQPLPSAAQVETTWVHRGAGMAGTAAGLATALAALPPLEGEGYAWIAAESEVAKTLRVQAILKFGLEKDRIKAAGYWKRGNVATHETHQD
jgi:NADPH-dependent ferric siderophore reductase